MIYVTDLRIEPNPAAVGQGIVVQVEVKELYNSAKRYQGKYPYRYGGILQTEGRKYPYKYSRK